jgi:hypothetical protein
VYRTGGAVLIAVVTSCANAQWAGGDALLAVDQTRASLIKRIVEDWKTAAHRAQYAMTPEQFGDALWSLRSDRLLVASLAGDFSTIERLIAGKGELTRSGRGVGPKALGDSGQDVPYTPVTPCRIVDTRTSAPLSPGIERTFVGYSASGFALQGGVPVGDCMVPNGAAALALNVVAYQPSNLGYITLWPTSAPEPFAATVSFDSGATNVSTGAVVPVDVNNVNSFKAKSPVVVHMIVDVVGYFRATTALALPNLELTPISHPTYGDTANIVAGSSANSVAAGIAGATIAGGGCNGGNNCSPAEANAITGDFGTVSGGRGNSVGGIYSTVGGGYLNTATGFASTVAGGAENRATGSFSFAAGTQARADFSGCFVFSDSTEPLPTFCGADHRFVVRAKGGFRFYTGGQSFPGYTGAELAPGATAWTTLSDVSSKENFAAVDALDVLDRLTSIPIRTWNWKSQDASIRHIGPSAQDFAAAFSVGETPRGISTVDADGVALAAIQGLNTKLENERREIARLRSEVAELRALRGELVALRALVTKPID